MLLLRRCSSPLVAARSRIGGTGVAPLWPAIAQWQLSALSHAFSSSSTTTSAAVRAPSRSTPTALLFTRTSLSPATSSSLRLPPGLSPLPTMQLRCYSPGRNPWQNGNDWKTMAKTGALVVLGTGALVASTSVAFGLIIAGAAGYGVYSLYQRFFGPYRSGFGSSSDPFGGVSSNIDALNDMFGRSASRRQNVDARSPRRGRSAVQDDLDSLVQGMPLVVRGLVKTIFSFVGRAMKSSMERAGELRRRTNEYLQANKRVREQMGDDVSVGGPQQWMESTVNGVGRVEAVFPVSGAYGVARVSMKATVGQGGDLNFQELKYRNSQTGETIDLLRDSSVSGRRKTVIDAEYVDLDDQNHESRW